MFFKKNNNKQAQPISDSIKKSVDEYIIKHSGKYKGIFAPLKGAKADSDDKEYSHQGKHERQHEIMRVPIQKIEKSLSLNGKSFKDKLLELIEASGMDDSDIWKRANMDRKHFSKIRCGTDCKPKKKTVMSLCIALKLNVAQAKDLMSRADLSFNPASKLDLIVGWAIENKIYDINEINDILYEYTQETLD